MTITSDIATFGGMAADQRRRFLPQGPAGNGDLRRARGVAKPDLRSVASAELIAELARRERDAPTESGLHTGNGHAPPPSGAAPDARVLRFEDVEMDLMKRQVRRAGAPINVTAREFALLEYFLRSPNRVLSRAMIAEQVWHMDFQHCGNVIEVYISRLRRKMDERSSVPLIRTVIKRGYMLGLACESPEGSHAISPEHSQEVSPECSREVSVEPAART